MNRLLIIASLLSTAAYAEDAPKAPEAPPTPVTEWYLKFDQPMMNALSQCIPEMPKKAADPFLALLQSQIGNQAAIISAIKAKP